MDEDKSRVDMAKAMKNLLENMPALLEYERIMAQITRAKYLALLGQGFTEPQAIVLCRKD